MNSCVPEDVAAICLPREAPSRDPGVDLRGVLADVDQQVEDVEAQLDRSELPAVLQLERADVPQLVPPERVLREKLVEVAHAAHLPADLEPRLGESGLARGAEDHDLLHVQRLSGGSLGVELEADPGLPLDHPAPSRDDLAIAQEARPGHLGDPDVGLARRRLEHDRLGVDRTGSDRHQVVAGETPVAQHPAVRHPPVEGRAEGHPARPVDGDHRHPKNEEVRVGHAHESLL